MTLVDANAHTLTLGYRFTDLLGDGISDLQPATDESTHIWLPALVAGPTETFSSG